MSRYISGRPTAYYDPGHWDDPMLSNLEVDGPSIVDTGILDQDGYPIYRVPPPIGFGRDTEWL